LLEPLTFEEAFVGATFVVIGAGVFGSVVAVEVSDFFAADETDFGFGFGRLFATGAGVGAGRRVGVAGGSGPNRRSKSERFGRAVSEGSDELGTRTSRPRTEVSSPFTTGRTVEVTRRATSSLRMGLVGNWREIVLYERLLSSLTSKSASEKAPALLRSWVAVDLGAIRRNLATLKSIGAPGLKIMAVVKANAYGHGAVEVVRALAGHVEMFGVANVAEADEIAEHARGIPICLLSGTFPGECATVIRKGYIPAVSTFAEAAHYAGNAAGARVRVHLAVDTGMGRLGVWEEEAVDTARRIMALTQIEITGIGSHLAAADEDPAFTAGQLTRFHSLVGRLREIGLRDALVHVENSAGLIGFPAQAGSMARPGLALYGESPLPSFQPQLERVLTWTTRVLLVRSFGAGRGVSYGRTFITPRPMRIATLATGFADGYPRRLSGRGAAVLIGGRRCAVLGRVTMDQIMVDVSAIDTEPGAEAVLLGRQGGELITATELASLAGTIPWDIFTGIGPRVTRLHADGDSSASNAPIPA